MKLVLQSAVGKAEKVAPFTGAWIETMHHLPHSLQKYGSPPSRGRGLKRRLPARNEMQDASPPSRGRGLKLGQ